MPDRPLRRFVFKGVYHEMGMIENTLDEGFVLQALPWTDPSLVGRLAKYSKKTLLHAYLFCVLDLVNRDSHVGDSDLFADDPGLACHLEDALAAYGVPFMPYAEFDAEYPDDEDAERHLREDGFYDTFRLWYHVHSDNISLMWERMADDIFYLLFGNRSFLLRFNMMLADYLRKGHVAIPKEYLDDKGVLKRQANVPAWVKKAVYYRDHGRYVFCQKDLSGLLSTDRKVHYDHMVPLNLWGMNDPCNLQLLCEDCNLRKGGTSSGTAAMYPDWWT
jgi:hypothetical protein